VYKITPKSVCRQGHRFSRVQCTGMYYMHTNYFNFGRLDRARVTTTPGTSTTVVVAIVTGVAICIGFLLKDLIG